MQKIEITEQEMIRLRSLKDENLKIILPGIVKCSLGPALLVNKKGAMNVCPIHVESLKLLRHQSKGFQTEIGFIFELEFNIGVA